MVNSLIKKREVKQINHYYPFGLTMNGVVNQADPTAYQLTQMKNNLKYNAGSELQELSGLYKYYRQYDAA